MMKLMRRLTTALLALMLALPTFGCQQKDKTKENEKGLDVQVDTGKAKVKVQGSKKPDEKGSHVDVEVERHPGHESGNRDKQWSVARRGPSTPSARVPRRFRESVV